MEGGTKGIARISLKGNGYYKVYIRIMESAHTPYRFVQRRNYGTGKMEYEVREFDAEKGVFEEIIDDDELSDTYQAHTESFEDAVQHMRDILQKIAEQDKILAKKARREEYEWTTSPSGDVMIQKKLQGQ